MVDMAMPDDTPVWRYLSLRAVIDTIRRGLRLTRVDTFRDPFEGVPGRDDEAARIWIAADIGHHLRDLDRSRFANLLRAVAPRNFVQKK
jgi:hypothetical protein